MFILDPGLLHLDICTYTFTCAPEPAHTHTHTHRGHRQAWPSAVVTCVRALLVSAGADGSSGQVAHGRRVWGLTDQTEGGVV